ncbi:Detected protein of confused Function [Hibiscus syriacus]|uniref:Detected protein of confused Function n=1 Tax=Hibiscus syriacus TaxID=106335 RepID=A0A6A3BHG1_HIBSY|nr:Detected protein of confused Function [Hibiscus syriacus]
MKYEIIYCLSCTCIIRQDSIRNTTTPRVKTMSLVSSAEPAITACRNTKLCSVQGSGDGFGLSTQMFGTDKHRPVYLTDSYSRERDEKYFDDSPLEDLTHPSSSEVSRSSFPLQDVSSDRLRDYLEVQSADTFDADTDKMKLMLQELERDLVADNDVDVEDMLGAGLNMEIDGEWSGPIRTESIHEPPKESSSLDSNLNRISSHIEASHVSSRTPKQMLIECAAILAEGNIELASAIINELRQLVSIQGDPPQRIAAYMVEGLAARVAASGKYLYKALKCKEPPSDDRLAAMQFSLRCALVLNSDLWLQMVQL